MILILLAAGCRLGFDTPPPIHHYQLQGTYADKYGGPELVPQGGGFIDNANNAGYQFEPNQGLALPNAMPLGHYTIYIRLSLEQLSGLRKVLDFSALTSTRGLYVRDHHLAFYLGGAQYASPITPQVSIAGSTMFEITLSRDGLGHTIGYVDGSPQFELDDTGSAAAFTRSNAVAYFVMDEETSNTSQASSGVIHEIRIWDVVLTEEQIAQLR